MTKPHATAACITQFICFVLFVPTAFSTEVWREISSPNFVIISDLDQAKAVDQLRELEKFRVGGLLAIGLRPKQRNSKVKVYHLSKKSFVRYAKYKDNGAGFVMSSISGVTMVAGPGSLHLETNKLLFHEFVHYMIREYSTFHYPRWYKEGVAELLSTLRLDGSTVRVGKIPTNRMSWLQHGPERSLGSVISGKGARSHRNNDVAMFYSYSWALTHYLHTGWTGGGTDRRAQLKEYLGLYNDGVDSEDAFRKSFDTSYLKMRAELLRFFRSAKFYNVVFELPEALADFEVETRTLSDSEAQYLIAWLSHRALGVSARKKARKLLEKSIATDLANALPLVELANTAAATGQLPEAIELLDQALKIKPVSAAVLTEGANALDTVLWETKNLPEGDQVEILIRKIRSLSEQAIAIDPTVAKSHFLLARSYSYGGRDIPRAINHMKDACTRMPWSIQVNFELGRLFAKMKYNNEARSYLKRVVNWSHGGKLSEKAQKLLDKMP